MANTNRFKYVSVLLAASIVFGLLVPSPSISLAKSQVPPSLLLKSSLVVKQDGVVCGYVPSAKSTKARKDWRPGFSVGKSRFTSHESAEIFYKKLGKKYRNRFLNAVKKKKADAGVCNQLSTLKFQTRGVVALGLVDKTTVSSKSVHTFAKRKSVGGLYGINGKGDTKSVITAIDEKDVSISELTSIEKIYFSPDNSMFVWYSLHPDGCLIGRVPYGATQEKCFLPRSEFPAGYAIGDAGGAAADTTEIIQFDSVGNVYVNIRGWSADCPVVDGRRFGSEAILQILLSGSQTVIGKNCDFSTVYSWSPINSGGVIFNWKQDFTIYKSDDLGTLKLWRDGNESILKQNLLTSANGIYTMPTGNTIINLFSTLDEGNTSQGGMVMNVSQGGMLKYSENDNSLSTWYHEASQSPTFVHESLTSTDCADCGALIKTLIARNATSIYGIGGKYLWKLYPTVSPRYQLNKVGLQLLSISSNFALAAGPGLFTSCDIQKINDPNSTAIDRIKYACPELQYQLINLKTSEVTTFDSPMTGMAAVTIAASEEANTFMTQAVRLSDKKLMVGIFDGASKSVMWKETSDGRFRWAGMLSR